MEVAAFIIFFTVLVYEIIKEVFNNIILVKNLNKKTTSVPVKKQAAAAQKKVIYNNTYNIIITDIDKIKGLHDKKYIDIK